MSAASFFSLWFTLQPFTLKRLPRFRDKWEQACFFFLYIPEIAASKICYTHTSTQSTSAQEARWPKPLRFEECILLPVTDTWSLHFKSYNNKQYYNRVSGITTVHSSLYMLVPLSLSWWKLWAQFIIWVCEWLHREGLTHICNVTVNVISTCRPTSAASLSFKKNNEHHSEAHFSFSLFPLPDLPHCMCTLRGQKIKSYHKSSILFALISFLTLDENTELGGTSGSADSLWYASLQTSECFTEPFSAFQIASLPEQVHSQRTPGSTSAGSPWSHVSPPG